MVGWKAAKSILEQWAVLLAVLWGPPGKHREVYELMLLINTAEEVNALLQAQFQHQPTIPTALVQLIQTDFNESFRQIFTSVLLVRSPELMPLMITLTTGHFRPESVYMSGRLGNVAPNQAWQKRVREPPGKVGGGTMIPPN